MPRPPAKPKPDAGDPFADWLLVAGVVLSIVAALGGLAVAVGR